MDPWVLWLLAALALGAVELFAGGTLAFGMVAVGALAGAVAAAATDSIVIQFGVFGLVSAAMVALVRPVARRHMSVPMEIRSGAAALVGADALVLEQVTGRDGRVKLRGEVWSARSYDGATEYDPGQTVQVLQIDGATALVA